MTKNYFSDRMMRRTTQYTLALSHNPHSQDKI